MGEVKKLAARVDSISNDFRLAGYIEMFAAFTIGPHFAISLAI